MINLLVQLCITPSKLEIMHPTYPCIYILIYVFIHFIKFVLFAYLPVLLRSNDIISLIDILSRNELQFFSS